MKKQIFYLLAIFSILTIWSSTVPAQEIKVGDMTISGVWARATARTAKTGAAYMMLANAGKTDDKLVAAKSDVAMKTQIHQSLMDNGIMKMRHAGEATIPAGGKMVFRPGGYHVMFMGLKAPLKSGDTFPMTLVFEKSGKAHVQVMVQKGPGMKMKRTTN